MVADDLPVSVAFRWLRSCGVPAAADDLLMVPAAEIASGFFCGDCFLLRKIGIKKEPPNISGSSYLECDANVNL